MAALMQKTMKSAGFAKQQAAPNSARAVRMITRVKVDTTPDTKNKTQQTNVEYLRSLPGITQPFPDVFDPFGLSTSTQTRDLKRWRESEIVHGRVAMLAALGFLVGEQLEDFPAFVNFDGHITGPAIGHFQQVRQGFWEPLIIAIGVAESYRIAIGWETPVGEDFNRLKEDYEPGNLGFDPLNLKPTDPQEYKDMQTKELNNGRLAMIGIAGLVAQELVDHKEVFEHLFRNVEAKTGIELPEVPKGLNAPNIPTLGIPKPEVPMPGPAPKVLPDETNPGNLFSGLQSNIDKLKTPSDLAGLKPNVNAIKDGASNAKDAITDNLPNPSGLFGQAKDAIKDGANSAKDAIKDNAPNTSGFSLPSFGQAKDAVKDTANSAKDAIKDNAPSGFSLPSFGQAKDAIKDSANNAKDLIKDNAFNAKDAIKDNAFNAKEAVKDTFRN